jgi:hypothetical protein
MYYAISKKGVTKLADRSATLAFIARTGRDEIKEIYKMPKGWRCNDVNMAVIVNQGIAQDIHFKGEAYNAA